MKIGIIIFSNTGNTLSLAERIGDTLKKGRHTVRIEQITTDGDPQKMGNDIKFNNIPKTDPFDAIIFGSPVWAFSLCPVMKEYLSKMDPLKGKKIALFTTKMIPFHWMGGNNAISQMKKLVGSRGGRVIGSGIVAWNKKGPAKNVDDVIDNISGLF